MTNERVQAPLGTRNKQGAPGVSLRALWRVEAFMSIEAMKQWAEGVSKAYDLTAWGHSERAAEILRQTRDGIRTAIEQAKFDAAHEALEKQAGIHVSQQSAEKSNIKQVIHLYDEPPAAPVQDECVVCGDKVRVIPRHWVGLTDADIDACDSLPDYDISSLDLRCFARAIEAKLREKNGGQA